MPVSPDPMLGQLQAVLKDMRLGKPETAEGALDDILSNPALFGCDLNAVGLGGKITGYFKELIDGLGAVRTTLKKYPDRKEFEAC